MRISKKISDLLDNGIKSTTLSNLTESQLNVLHKRLMEQVTPLPPKQSYKIGVSGGPLPPSDKGYAIKKNPDNTIVATPLGEESEVNEKFESKKQQKYLQSLRV